MEFSVQNKFGTNRTESPTGTAETLVLHRGNGSGLDPVDELGQFNVSRRDENETKVAALVLLS